MSPTTHPQAEMRSEMPGCGRGERLLGSLRANAAVAHRWAVARAGEAAFWRPRPPAPVAPRRRSCGSKSIRQPRSFSGDSVWGSDLLKSFLASPFKVYWAASVGRNISTCEVLSSFGQKSRPVCFFCCSPWTFYHYYYYLFIYF